MQVLFEPINEPWGHTNPQFSGAEYAKVIAKLLPEVKAAGIPIADIYVGAVGIDCVKEGECVTNGWVPAMYAAEPSLETEIQGWYFHPYGRPSGLDNDDDGGIQAVPVVQGGMTSGQNNIIVSEVGYCDTEINKEECSSENVSGTGAQTGKWMTEMLDNALPYHEAGWLKALIIYSRNAGGWAMQEYPSQVLSKGGEALDAFANVYGRAWSIPSTPNPTGAKSSALAGVSCTSSEACTAVGHYVNSSSVEVPLAERLSVKTWKAQEPKIPTGAKSSSLGGVSCTSSEACIAVGHYVNSSSVEVPLAEKWNGTEWTIKEPKTPTGAKTSNLSGVSCTSSEACVAVGHYVNSSSVEVPLAEKWSGTEWTIKEPKTPTGAKSSSLGGASCTSSEACIAVGHYVNSSSVEVPLAEKWTGSEWAIEEPKTPTGAKSSSLAEVSCISSEACTAVGHDINSSSIEVPLVERWNGKEWTVQEPKTLAGAKSSSLAGVSCRSSEACTAVGHYVNSSSVEVPLAERWNGKEWAILTTATPKEAKSSSLSGVSCRSGETCDGTGHYVNGSGVEMALAESYTLHAPYVKTEPATGVTKTGATLQGIVSPEGQETTYHFEYGKTISYGTSVPVPSGNVGASTSDLEESKVITGLEPETTYHFRVVATNGTGTVDGSDQTFTTLSPSWSVEETPNPAGEPPESWLRGVSCSSSMACTAIGEYKNKSRVKVAFAERWNGTEWSLQEPGMPSGAKGSWLTGVSCSSSTACAAVGYYTNSSSVGVTLAERWNGTEWSLQEARNATGAESSELSGVACSSSTACTAVGSYTSAGVRVPLAERWNGTEWSLQEPGVPSGAKGILLSGVSCSSSTACTAVGIYTNSSGVGVTLAERWNGTEWSIQSTPNPTGAEGSSLRSVSCPSSTACTAVGTYTNSSGVEVPLAERWNGTEWSIQSTPSPSGAKFISLNSVSCPSSTACTAVGVYFNTSQSRDETLAERWNGTEWSIQATPSHLGTTGSFLYGVSCASPTVCTAVGEYEGGSHPWLTLADGYS